MSIEHPDIASAPDQKIPDQSTLEWHDGDMPYSQEFGDHFYCREDGRLECGYVFLEGNGLPQRWLRQPDFTIGELGFGTGLNFCETWRRWKETRTPDGRLHYISFERFPMQAEEIGKALSCWPEIAIERQALCDVWPKMPTGHVTLDFPGGLRLTVACGAAFNEIESFAPHFDAWYLDGFAPRRNPDMWSEALMCRVYEKTVEGGTFATYAAAGFVRRNLQAAGFTVDRRKGFGSKREMLSGVKSSSGVA